MSSATSNAAGRGFLRGPRRGEEIRLGADGRVQSAEEAFAGPEATNVAATIVERAQERADTILRESAMTVATVQQEAYAEGFTAGQRDGVVAGRADLVQAIALVQRMATEGAAIRDQLVAQAEREIVELVIVATRSVIGDRIATDPDLVHETVRRALERAGSQNVIRLRVSPGEHERVSVRLVENHREVTPFQIAADGSVRVGGCIVDTEAGRVDARLDVQLGGIVALLRNALPAQIDDGIDDDADADAAADAAPGWGDADAR